MSIFPVVLLKRTVLNRMSNNKSSDVETMPKLINSLILKILFLESLALKYISFPFGSSILILARKNKYGKG